MRKYSDYLMFNPYANKVNYLASWTEEDFYTDFFVNFDSDFSVPLDDDLVSALHANSQHSKTITYINGQGGSGKSTYLHNFFRKNRKKFESYFLNMIQTPSSVDDKTILSRTVKENITLDIDELSYLCEHLQKLLDDSNNNIDSDWLSFTKWLTDNEKEALRSYLTVIHPDMLPNIKLEKTQNLLNKLEEESLLYIYCISKITSFIQKEKHTNKSIIIIFDNLDEFSHVYLCHQFHKIFMDLVSKVQTYCDNVLKFDWHKHLHFVLCLRNVNFVLLSPQIQEYHHFMSTSIRFNAISMAPEILQRRIELIEKDEEKDNTEPNSLEKQLIKDETSIIKDDQIFTKKIIAPLFNFDNRIISHAILEMTETKQIKRINSKGEAIFDGNGKEIYDKLSMLKANLEEYKYIKDTLCCESGARGILIFAILKYLYNRSNAAFKTIVNTENKEHCNPYRMVFALLYNLSRTRRVKKLEILTEEDYDSIYTSIPLTQVLSHITKYRSSFDSLKDVFRRLFKIDDFNYELFAVIENLLTKEEEPTITKINEAIERTISMMDFHLNSDFKVNHKQENKLSTITIKINSSPIVYANRIFIHYEYFNLLKNSSNTDTKWLYRTKSLFQSLEIQDNNKFEFEIQIDSIIDFIDTYIKSTDSIFCEKFCEKKCSDNGTYEKCSTAIDAFINNQFCINGIMYISRALTSHMHYIDVFREFIWKHEEFQDGKLEGRKIKPNLKSKKEIQSYLLEIIGKYIYFLTTKKVQDKKIKERIDDFKKKHREAIEANNNGKWLAITGSMDKI